jgi:hypothetical protein
MATCIMHKFLFENIISTCKQSLNTHKIYGSKTLKIVFYKPVLKFNFAIIKRSGSSSCC